MTWRWLISQVPWINDPIQFTFLTLEDECDLFNFLCHYLSVNQDGMLFSDTKTMFNCGIFTVETSPVITL